MRKLETHDLFVAMRLVNTSGIKEEFEKMAVKVADMKQVNLQEVGISFLISVLSGCSNDSSEKLIYEFLGGILEIAPDEIRKMDPMDLVKNLQELKNVINVEEWKAFFISLRKILHIQG